LLSRKCTLFDIESGTPKCEFDDVKNHLFPFTPVRDFSGFRPFSALLFKADAAAPETPPDTCEPKPPLKERIVLRAPSCPWNAPEWRLNFLGHSSGDKNKLYILVDGFGRVVSTEFLKELFIENVREGRYDTRRDERAFRRKSHMDFCVRTAKGEAVVMTSRSWRTRRRGGENTYVFRSGTVPGVRNFSGGYKGHREFRTFAEMRDRYVPRAVEDFLDSVEVGDEGALRVSEGFSVRTHGTPIRKRYIPDPWDDLPRYVRRSWKAQGKSEKQWCQGAKRRGGGAYVAAKAGRHSDFSGADDRGGEED